VALVPAGCDDGGGLLAVGASGIDARLELVADGLASPVFVTDAPGDPTRLFVVEQGGVIRVIRNGELLDEPFLDLGDRVTVGDERGLLGMAFDPLYVLSGYFFVSYTDESGDTRIARFTVTRDPDVANPASELEILSVLQPEPNHNGGMLAFGFDDMLYVGLGDGGGSGDPHNHGQDPRTLLGSMLRIDVRGATEAEPYWIPLDNPFLGDPDAREETWVFGLRNPWRFSFDRLTGDLYIGDVGQGVAEEVSVQPGTSGGGENFGWSRMEGSQCFRPATGCSSAGLVRPAYEYGHEDGCSVTGGYVYRGTAIQDLVGRYLFADYCGGWIRSFVLDGDQARDVRDHTADLDAAGSIVSFGEDAAGELYVVVHEGEIYRIVPG